MFLKSHPATPGRRARRHAPRGAKPAVERLERLALLSTTAMPITPGGQPFAYVDSAGNAVNLRISGQSGQALISEAGNAPAVGDVTSIVITGNSPDLKLTYSSASGGPVHMGSITVFGSSGGGSASVNPFKETTTIGSNGSTFILDSLVSPGGISSGSTVGASQIAGAVVLSSLPSDATINVTGTPGGTAIAAGAPIIVTGDLAGTVNVGPGNWAGALNVGGSVAPSARLNVGGTMRGAVTVGGSFAGHLNDAGATTNTWNLGSVAPSAIITAGGGINGPVNVSGNFGGKLSANNGNIAAMTVGGNLTPTSQVTSLSGSAKVTAGGVQAGARVNAYYGVNLTVTAGDTAGTLVAGDTAAVNVQKESMTGTVISHDSVGATPDTIQAYQNVSGTIATNGETTVTGNVSATVTDTGGRLTVVTQSTNSEVSGSLVADFGARLNTAGSMSGNLDFWHDAYVTLGGNLAGLIQGNATFCKGGRKSLTHKGYLLTNRAARPKPQRPPGL
jgi:hypothetical protein